MQMRNTAAQSAEEQSVLALLNSVLADEHVLYVKTRNYHWNVLRAEFYAYHKFFESQYEELENIIDRVAERARMVGGRAPGTMAERVNRARLREQPGETPDAQTMIMQLLHDHEQLISSLRNDIEVCESRYHDKATADFLSDLLGEHDKIAWMLRASLGQH